MSLQTPPKKKRIKRVYRHPNSLFEKWLQEWYDEAKARESQMKFNYARAIKSLRLFPLPLYRGADCKVLSGFGDKICQQIERRMEKHIQEFGPIDWEEYHQVVEHSAPRKKRAKKASSTDVNNESLNMSGKKRCRQYIPAVRSGAYAILMAFNQGSTDDGFPVHLKRTELIEMAQEFCDASFTQTPDGSHYTAWSSMSTLIKKKLITKEGSPARYALTISGEELCKRLVSVEDGTNMQLHLRQEDVDDPDPVSDLELQPMSSLGNTKQTKENITNERNTLGNIEIDMTGSSLISPNKKSQDDWSYSHTEDSQEFLNNSDSSNEESISEKNQNSQDTIAQSSNISKQDNSPNATVSQSILEEFDICTLLDDSLSHSTILAGEINLLSNKTYEHLSQAVNLHFPMNTEIATLEAASTMEKLKSCKTDNTVPSAELQYSKSSIRKKRSSKDESKASLHGSFENLFHKLQSGMDKLSSGQKNVSGVLQPKDTNVIDNAMNHEGDCNTDELLSDRLTPQKLSLQGDTFRNSSRLKEKNQNIEEDNQTVSNEICTYNTRSRQYESEDTMEKTYNGKKYWKRNGKNDSRKNKHFTEDDASKPYKKWSYKKNKRRKRKKTESSSDEESIVLFPEIMDEPKEPLSAIVPPINCTVPTTSWKNLVFFDLETTSLKLDCDIVQIAAIDGSSNDKFNLYVLPTKKMDKMASFITGISYKKGILRHNFKPVYAKPTLIALEKFLFWIQQRTPVMLVAHNASFDSKRLFYALNLHRLTSEFKKHTLGFVDTLPLFQKKLTNLPNHRQETVVKHVLDLDYEAHNALEDVKSLKEAYNATFLNNSTQNMESASTDFVSAHERWLYEWEGKKKVVTFSDMISKKCVSENMADKMATSGLTCGNLEFVYKSKGVNGIELLLGKTGTHGKPRVTKNKRVINDIVKYFTLKTD